MREATTRRDAGGGRPPPAEAGTVLLVCGDGAVSARPLTTDEVVIGRSRQCDVSLEHEALSRRHAILRWRGAVTVQDLGSTNGTRIAGALVRGGAPRPLPGGEGFGIGPFSFLLVPARPTSSSWGAAGAERLVVRDPADRSARLVRDVAASEVNVLIQGETGVGKEVLAETVHALSGRAGPLVRINCAALTETLLESELFGHDKGAFTGAVGARAGLLEAAAGGTVFLDELGELPAATQAKLLRAVEAREVIRLGSTRPVAIDVRFVAATHRDLATEVAAGRFRHDLYFRLDGVTLRIPPLRERREQIGPLALAFLAEAGARGKRGPVRASPQLLAALEAHAWPGNVRELRAVLERARLLARGDVLGVRDVAFSPAAAPPAGSAAPPAVPAPTPPAAPADDELGFLTAAQRAERAQVIAALAACGGNQTRAARALGLARSTLVTKLALYRIARPKT